MFWFIIDNFRVQVEIVKKRQSTFGDRCLADGLVIQPILQSVDVTEQELKVEKVINCESTVGRVTIIHQVK